MSDEDFETIKIGLLTSDLEERRWLTATSDLPYQRRAIDALELHLQSSLPTSLFDPGRLTLETGMQGSIVRDYAGEIGWIVTVGTVSIRVGLREAIEMPMMDLAALVPDRLNDAFSARAARRAA